MPVRIAIVVRHGTWISDQATPGKKHITMKGLLQADNSCNVVPIYVSKMFIECYNKVATTFFSMLGIRNCEHTSIRM